MKNIIGKIVIIAVLAMMVMMMCGFTYETEEVPTALIEELEFEGFVQDEDEENIWSYEEYLGEIGDRTYIYAWFDTDENVGMVTAYKYTEDGHIAAICTGTVSWNTEIDDFDELAYMEKEF